MNLNEFYWTFVMVLLSAAPGVLVLAVLFGGPRHEEKEVEN